MKIDVNKLEQDLYNWSDKLDGDLTRSDCDRIIQYLVPKILSLKSPTLDKEPFKMPTDKQLVDIAILFSQDKGIINKMELANMIAMSEFILYRLHENKDVMIPSTIESKD